MIRRAVPADAMAMGQVLSDWIDATPWMPRLHTRVEDAGFCAHLIETAEVWIAQTTDGLGFLARKGAEIDALYLADGLRGHGWGTRLLDAAKVGCTRLELWTFQANAAAIRFYEACGFHEVERTDGEGNDEILPDCRMRWERATS